MFLFLSLTLLLWVYCVLLAPFLHSFGQFSVDALSLDDRQRPDVEVVGDVTLYARSPTLAPAWDLIDTATAQQQDDIIE